MFKSLIELVKDVTEIVTAPVEIAVDTARAVTKPMAETAKELTDTVKQEILGEDSD